MGKKSKDKGGWPQKKTCDMCNGGGTISIRNPKNPDEWRTLKCGECGGKGYKLS